MYMFLLVLVPLQKKKKNHLKKILSFCLKCLWPGSTTTEHPWMKDTASLTSGCVFWSWLLALVSSLGWVVSMLGGFRKRLSSCCWLSLRLWMMLHDCCCFCRKMLCLHQEERCPASLPHSYQVTFFFPL